MTSRVIFSVDFMSKSRNILASIALSKGKKFNFLKFWEHEKKLLKKNKKILG